MGLLQLLAQMHGLGPGQQPMIVLPNGTQVDAAQLVALLGGGGAADADVVVDDHEGDDADEADEVSDSDGDHGGDDDGEGGSDAAAGSDGEVDGFAEID